MKVFIIGLPKSGNTRFAKALAEDTSTHYISASDWVQSTFRLPRQEESRDDYDQAYHEFYVKRIQINQNLCVDNVQQAMFAADGIDAFVIDGLIHPGDFTRLFDINKDVVVFLNRTDSPATPKDYEGVAVNVLRDYCLYLATLGLLPRERWLEYNYRIPGEESDFVKQLGKHNTVTITKSINKAIEHLKGELCKLQTGN